jgi:y4mF family transcriptional regulator
MKQETDAIRSLALKYLSTMELAEHTQNESAAIDLARQLFMDRKNKTSKQQLQTYPITTATNLAPLIRASRKRMKMSQQQFADAAGVGRRFLSELENGKPSLEFDKVIACALAAGIDIIAKPRTPL